MAEEKRQEDVGKAIRAQSMEEFAENTKGKPTPTQDENDRAALGEHLAEHEPDGSDEQNVLPPHQQRTQHREVSGQRPGQYPTRQTTAQPASQPQRPRQSE